MRGVNQNIIFAPMSLAVCLSQNLHWQRMAAVCSLLLVLFVAQPHAARAENVDSLEQMLQRPEQDTTRVMSLLKLCFHYEALDPQKALPYAREALALAEGLDYAKGIGWGYFRIGLTHFYANRPQQGLDSLEIAKGVFANRGRRDHVSTTLLKMGLCYVAQGHYEKATDTYFEAIDLREQLNDSAGVAWAQMYLASGIFHRINDYENTIKYAEQAAVYFERHDDSRGLTGAYTVLANAYDLGKQYEQALDYQKRVQAMFHKHGHARLEAGILFNMGLTNKKMGNFKEAQRYLERALIVSDSTHFLSCAVKCLNNLGSVYQKTGNAEKGLVYLRRGIHLADSLHDGSALEQGQLMLSNVYRDMGRFEDALDLYVKYANLHDSMYHNKTEINIRELETRYETKAKEAEIQRKSQELQFLKETQKTQTILYVAGIVCLLLLLVIVVLLLKQSRMRQRQEEVLHLAAMAQSMQERDDLEHSMQYKNQQLVSYALQLTQKNEKITTLQQSLGELKESMADDVSKNKLEQLSRQIDLDQSLNSDWEVFKTYFEQVHVGFFKHLKTNYPVLSGNDLRLCAFLKLNMTTKEIANVLGMPPKSVEIARYRLRKKLNLTKGDKLSDFILNIS